MKNDENKEKSGIVPIKLERPEESSKLRRLTDDEIINGFRYLIH